MNNTTIITRWQSDEALPAKRFDGAAQVRTIYCLSPEHRDVRLLELLAEAKGLRLALALARRAGTSLATTSRGVRFNTEGWPDRELLEAILDLDDETSLLEGQRILA